MDILILGFLTAVGFYILMWKINIYLFTEFDWQVDFTFSLAMLMIMAGTFTGTAVAIVSGIFMSIFLFITKVLIR